MKILVCIKESCEEGEMNRFDTFALEEALVLKETLNRELFPDVSVDVLTLGCISASRLIKRAYGMGADHGIHILTPKSDYSPALITASALAPVIDEGGYDLILTGIMSEDMMAGQTGPMLAEILGLPCTTGVIKANLPDTKTIYVERELESGFVACMTIKMPCVLTLHAGINTPRYPSLSNMLTAGKKEITTLLMKTIVPEPVTEKEDFVALIHPAKTRSGRELTGSLTEKAGQLRLYLERLNYL